MASRADQRALVFDGATDQYIHVDLLSEGVTFETLFANGGTQGEMGIQISRRDTEAGTGRVQLRFGRADVGPAMYQFGRQRHRKMRGRR